MLQKFRTGCLSFSSYSNYRLLHKDIEMLHLGKKSNCLKTHLHPCPSLRHVTVLETTLYYSGIIQKKTVLLPT